MPLPFQPQYQPTQIQQAGRKELTRSLSQGISSVMDDPLKHPTEMLGRAANAFEGFTEVTDKIPVVGSYVRAAQAATEMYDDPLPRLEIDLPDGSSYGADEEMLTPQQVEYEYGHLGLRVKEPVKRSEIRYLANQKEIAAKQQEIWDASPGGFAAGTAYVGAGLLSTAIDPLNVLTAFIPAGAIGGKAATLMGGKVVGRMAIGGVEGLIGNALVEPIVYGAATQMQMDYTVQDALTNLALGTALGSAIHVGGGAVKDYAVSGRGRRQNADVPNAPEYSEARGRSELSPVGREIQSTTAISQVLQGRDVKPEVTARVDRKARQDMSRIFNDENRETALSHQIRRYRMYEMAEGRDDLPGGVKEDIEDARAAVLDAAVRDGLEVSSIEELQELVPDTWRTAAPETDTKVRDLVERLKADREQWRYDKRNPERMPKIMDLIRQHGVDPDSVGAPELRKVIDGANMNLGGGKWIFPKKKKGLTLDEIGELATGPDGVYVKRPTPSEIVEDIRDAIHGNEARMVTERASLSDELVVRPNGTDEEFERAARIHVAEELRPEPTRDVWDRTLADSPEELQELAKEIDEPVKLHLDENLEYTIDEIKAHDTELDQEIQYLRNQGIELDEDVLDSLLLDEWTKGEDVIDEAFGIGVACVKNG